VNHDNCLKVIIQETIKESGFMFEIRKNNVDKKKFKALCNAIDEMKVYYANKNIIDKRLVACLFEVPWQIENVVEHYSEKSELLGNELSNMADEVRGKIDDLLWEGLEDAYK